MAELKSRFLLARCAHASEWQRFLWAGNDRLGGGRPCATLRLASLAQGGL